jgi:glucokinase
MSQENIIAIDLGATNTRVALLTKTGQVLKKETAKTPHQGDNQVLINSILNLLTRIYAISDQNLIGAGICVPGWIDVSQGLLTTSANLPYQNVQIVEPIKSFLNTRVVLSNDANAAAIGEKIWGQARETHNFAYLTLSSGIGGAIYQDGRLLTDEKGDSVEIGHIEIGSEYDLKCGCGGKNHWEAYASGTNMVNFLRNWADKKGQKPDFDGNSVYSILEAVEDRNEIATNFFEQVMVINLEGINYLIKKYKPELIAIGGGVYLNHQPLFNHYLANIPYIKPSFFGDDASLIGAGASVLA